MTTPYFTYKFSDLKWLKDIPAHWKIDRLGHIGQFLKGTGGSKEDRVSDGVPCVRYGDLYMHHEYFIEEADSHVSEENYSKYTPIQFGDVLFAGSGETIEDIGKSAVNLINSQVCCGSDIILFRAKIKMDYKFFGYLLGAPQISNQKSCMGQGVTVAHIYIGALKHLWIVLPPLSEQMEIAQYLDDMSLEVQRYVEAKTRQINLLKELKTGIIHRTVTRGLKHDAPLKNSRVKWLGNIPQHWRVRRLKRLSQLIMGQSPDSKDYSYEKAGLPFLQGCAEFGPYQPKPIRFCRAPKKISPQNAILLSVRAPVGRLNIADREYGIGRGLCAIIPNQDQLHINFAFYGLTLMEHGFSIVSTGSTYDAVSIADVGGQFIAIPPLSEQKAIVAYLEEKTAEIDAAIVGIQCEINLLQEYRIRLISDTVTGRLDVRKASRQLTDVTPERA